MQRIIKSTGVIFLATGLSRILGFVRDLLLAELFGTSIQAQAFVGLVDSFKNIWDSALPTSSFKSVGSLIIIALVFMVVMYYSGNAQAGLVISYLVALAFMVLGMLPIWLTIGFIVTTAFLLTRFVLGFFGSGQGE